MGRLQVIRELPKNVCNMYVYVHFFSWEVDPYLSLDSQRVYHPESGDAEATSQVQDIENSR